MAKSETGDDAGFAESILSALPPPGREPSGPCPPADQLGGFAEGRLVPGEREALERHLAECAACREVVVALSEEAGPATVRAPAAIPRRGPRWASVAAAAAVLALALVGLRFLTRPDDPGTARDTESALAAEAEGLVRADPGLFAGFAPLGRAERLEVRPVERSGSEFALLAPVGKVLAPPEELVWTRAPGAERYEIVIRDAQGRKPWTIPGAAAPAAGGDVVRVPVALDPPPAAGESHLWKVSATGDTGDVQATATFSVAAPDEKDRLARAAVAIDTAAPPELAGLLKAHFALRSGFLAEAERHARAVVAARPGDAVARETLHAVLNRIGSPESSRWRD